MHRREHASDRPAPRAQSHPTAERSIVQHSADDFERQFEPIRLLRVDGELKVVRLGQAREFEQAGHKLAAHPLARNRFIARMQRRELTEMPGRSRRCRIAGCSIRWRRWPRHKRRNIFRHPRSARTLAEHVERIKELRIYVPARASASPMVWPMNEMRAEKPHRLPRRRAHGRHTDAPHDAVEDGLRRVAWMDDAGGDAKRPGRGRDQDRRRFHVAVRASVRRRACPRSAGPRSRRRAREAAPRPAPSARGPPWSRANRRAGNLRCRRARPSWRGSPRSSAAPARRCGCPRHARARRRPGAAPPVPVPAERTVPKTAPGTVS